MARSSSPWPSASGLPPLEPRPPTSSEAVRARTATVKASTRSSVTNCSTVKSFNRARGQGDHRELETALQHYSSALFARIPTTGTGGLHARASGSAIRPSRSARGHNGTAPNPKLTSQPDHSIGAGQENSLHAVIPSAFAWAWIVHRVWHETIG